MTVFNRKNCAKLLLLCAAALLFNACLGASASITLRANGSGSIALEYRVSQALESLGRLDGNERWPAVPVGRADLERSAARIPGLRLSAFSAKDVPAKTGGGRDLLTTATLDFADSGAMLAFLDHTGIHATVTDNSLRLTLLEPAARSPALNADLLDLLQTVSAGYEISLALRAPRNARIAVSPEGAPGVTLESHGRTVSFAIDTGALFALTEGLTVEMVW